MAQEPEYHFDAHTQREVPRDPSEAAAWVDHLAAQGLVGEPMRVVWLRILGRLDEAEELGWRVLGRSGGPGSRTDALDAPLPLSAVSAAIRLAHVLQWQGEFPLACELHEQALAAIEAVEPMSEDSAYADYLRPFAYQHLARCYFDEGKYQKALEAAQRSFELRVNAGVPEDQVLSSSGLIDAIKARLKIGRAHV